MYNILRTFTQNTNAVLREWAFRPFRILLKRFSDSPEPVQYGIITGQIYYSRKKINL